MAHLINNEVAEIANMQKRIDDYDHAHEYIAKIVKTGKWDVFPMGDYFPRCGDLLSFLQYLCEVRPQIFTEYAKYREEQSKAILVSSKQKYKQPLKKSELRRWMRFGSE